MRQIDHHLAIDDSNRIVCRRCGHDLCGADQNFKEGAVMKVRPIQEANPLIVDPTLFIDDEVVFRQYFCPGCATLLESEVILASSPVLWDKKVGASTAARRETTDAADGGNRDGP